MFFMGITTDGAANMVLTRNLMSKLIKLNIILFNLISRNSLLKSRVFFINGLFCSSNIVRLKCIKRQNIKFDKSNKRNYKIC